MKKYLIIIWAFGVILGSSSCKKANQTIVTSSGAINVTLAVIGGAGTLDFNNPDQNVYNFSYSQFPVLAGQSPVNVYAPAIAATATTPAIPAVTYYNQPLSVVNNGNYSLFLAGTSPSQIDNVLIKESYHSYTDSVCGVRFINLSPGSNPVSVDVQGNVNGSEVPSIAYKAYNTFVQHSAKTADINNGINFEIRDASTGDVLTTYTLTPVTFRNVTLALSGAPGSQSIIQINNN